MKRTFILLAILSIAGVAAAQDTPRFGVVMGFPAEVGLLWNVSERVALRPELTWTKSSTESTTTVNIFSLLPGAPTTSVTSTADSNQVGVGVSGILYLSKGDALRTYVTPRLAYSRSSYTLDYGALAPALPVRYQPTTTTVTSYAAAGSIGAQYSLARRFAVFGELGVGYNHTGDRSPAISGTFSDTSTSGWTVGLRSGVGVVLFIGS